MTGTGSRTTGTDRLEQHSGYWPSPWPVECGGNRRQKARSGRLDAASGAATVTTRRNDRWNVMMIERNPGELFVGGTMAAFSGPAPFGWVDRIDPETLIPAASSPQLPCGDHVWCGAILAHANGSIYSINGSYIHRLSPDCEVITEAALPVDQAHNGFLALSDGTLITKDLRLEGQGPTTLTRLDPDTLQPVEPMLRLPEGSMGRIAAEATSLELGIGDTQGDIVYVPGTEHMWRIVVGPAGMEVDGAWFPPYRSAADATHGLAWDSCLSDGSAWIMDCGDIESIRLIYSTHPNGRWETSPGRDLSWRRPAPWPGAQRLLRVGLDEDARVDAIEPFGTAGGGIIAPPVHVPEHQMAIAWDSVNGGLAGIDTSSDELSVAWQQLDIRASMQPVVFPDSGELVINDFTDAGSDQLVVIDIPSGEILDRIEVGSRIANGMFLTAGGDRDVYYCTTTTLARVQWQ